MKKQKGITLIALVITIVVLLILSAVAISFITGDNGVLNQAVASKNNTLIAQYNENLKMALNSAKAKSVSTGNSVLEEAKALVALDELFAGAEIGEIEEEQFQVETKEGFVFTVTEEGVEFDESTAGGEVGGEDEEETNKISLTLKHIDSAGVELSETIVEEYDENESVNVESLEIEGYETSSVKIIAAEETETATGGSPLKMSFPIYQDTEIIITYEAITSGDAGEDEGTNNGTNSETNKDYSNVPDVKETPVPMVSKPIEADDDMLTDDTVQEEIEKADDYYAMDLEPIVNNNGPLTITLDMSDKAVDGDIATVMHRKDNGTWEKLGEYTVENLEITVTIDSFSPFVITVKHIVTDDNVGFVIGWKQDKNGNWSEAIENEAELVVEGDTSIVAKICRTSAEIEPGWISYMGRETYCGKGHELKLILEGYGNMGNVATIDATGYPTSAYAWQDSAMDWFMGESDICIIPYVTSVSIDENITSIGGAAFAGGMSIKTINMPNVTEIGDLGFFNCSGLYSLTIPNTVTKIGNKAFEYCIRVSQIRVPQSVQTIGANAFAGMFDLERLYIDGTLTSIGETAFAFDSYHNSYIYVKTDIMKRLIENYIDSNTTVRVIE